MDKIVLELLINLNFVTSSSSISPIIPFFTLDTVLHFRQGICHNIHKCLNKLSHNNLFYTCICRRVWYCTERCASDDYKEHKPTCEMVKIDLVEDLKKLTLNPNSLKCLVGLRNLNNTCYMNTALQCLSNTKELADYFIYDDYKSEINKDNILGSKGIVVMHFAYLIKQMHFGKDKTIGIMQFKKTIGKLHATFSGYSQEDSQEFLNYLLDTLHEDLNRVKVKIYSKLPELINYNDEEAADISFLHYLQRNQSVIVDLFAGQFKSTLKCLKCKKSTYSFDPFICLSLPIPVYNYIELNVFFVYFDIFKGIIKFTIEVDKDSTLLTLRNKLSKQLNLHPMSFLICTISNNNIERIFNIQQNVSQFEGINLFALQIDPKLHSQNEYYNRKVINSYINKRLNFDYPLSEEENANIKIVNELMDKVNTQSLKESYYSHIDHSYLENYQIKLEEKENSPMLYENFNIEGLKNSFNKHIDNNDLLLLYSKDKDSLFYDQYVQSLAYSLFIYTDLNNGLSDDYLKFCVKFKSVDLTNVNPHMRRKCEVSFQRIFFLNIKWSLSKVNQYFTDYLKNSFPYHVSNNESNFPNNNSNCNNAGNPPEDFDGKIEHELRFINVNKNKHNKTCFICKSKECDSCFLNAYNNSTLLEDILNLFPTNNKIKVDNNYLFLDFNQRKVAIPKSDLEFELILYNNKCSTSSNKNVSLNANINTNPYVNKSLQKQNHFMSYLHKMLTNCRIIKENISNSNFGSISNLNLLYNKNVSIYDCLFKFSQMELLEGNDECYCNNCKQRQPAKKKIEIWKASPILIIQLKRFKSENNQKIENLIDFPINDFSLRRFVNQSNYFSKNRLDNYKYDLYAVANHSGSITYGHYYAYCKNPYNNKWYKFDDNHITEMEEKSIVSHFAYVLFYKRKDIKDFNDSVWKEQMYRKGYIDYEEVLSKYKNKNKDATKSTINLNSNDEFSKTIPLDNKIGNDSLGIIFPNKLDLHSLNN